MSSTTNWLEGRVIGLSISESEDLLNHGFGREHLRELLLRLAQRVLRVGGHLAYGGHFRREGSFTRDLVELIGDEQREGGGDQRPWIGILYNHSPWPHYLDISDEDEANYIDACRFIRITQDVAGVPAEAQVDEPDSPERAAQARFVKAFVRSRMRRMMAEGMTLNDPGGLDETTPPVFCRVLVAGRSHGSSGILPGLYEEALYCLDLERPLYILGGFGGAAGRLAGYLDGRLDARDALLEIDALRAATPNLATVEAGFESNPWASDARRPADALASLAAHLAAARKDIAKGLRNGLDRAENARLFATADTAEAAELVLRGLQLIVASPAGTRAGGSASRRKKTAKRKNAR